MKRVEFKQSNFNWNAPVGQQEAVGTLRAYQGIEQGTGWPVSISCWEASQEELNEIIQTKQIWLRIYGPSHPVVSLSGLHPWEEIPSEGHPSYSELLEELEKLRKFKTYTHSQLDEMGVPPDPDPERNKLTGCRLACRLDWLKARNMDILEQTKGWDHPSSDGDL